MTLRVAVAGASGLAGGELLRLLAGHPHLDVGPLGAGESAGQAVTSVHPHLPSLAHRRFEELHAAGLADADLLFLALPHGQSGRIVEQLPAGLPVVDLGADFRLTDSAAWERCYRQPHAGHWPYGLPELFRVELAGAARLAGPGCYPTAVSLALGPLLSAGLVEAQDLVVVAASGTSGAGRSAAARLDAGPPGLAAYKVTQHQHTPEIRQNLGRAAGAEVTLSFTTVLAPMPRGILATCTARTKATEDQLRKALLQQYADERFVQVLPAGSWPHTAATVGTNSCLLQVAVDREAGRAVVVSALDNLGKGAAGQAVQCANLVLGFEEAAGLSVAGGAR